MNNAEAIKIFKTGIACGNEINNGCRKRCNNCEYFVSSTELNQAFDIAISALKKQDWIPVTEKLPEAAGRYMVTDGEYVWNADYSNDINPDALDPELVFDNGFAFGQEWDNLDNLDRVTAWREIPEPYQEKK